MLRSIGRQWRCSVAFQCPCLCPARQQLPLAPSSEGRAISTSVGQQLKAQQQQQLQEQQQQEQQQQMHKVSI